MKTSSARRRKGSHDRNKELSQLYRYNDDTLDAHLLLERKNLTNEAISDFCLGNDTSTDNDDTNEKYQQQVQAYRKRRLELHDLMQKHKVGEARVDEFGRLVPVSHLPQPPAGELPPPPPPRQNNEVPRHGDEDEQIWLRRQEQAAADAIARAVRRYREQGVPDEDLELIAVNPNDAQQTSLTFRRICFAVLAVVTAFICIMLQTIPIFHYSATERPLMDPLMSELLNIRLLLTHAKECPMLHREQRSLQLTTAFWEFIGSSMEVDCNQGVLHIPSMKSIVDIFLKSKSTEEVNILAPFIERGVQASWFMDCMSPAVSLSSSSSCIAPQSCIASQTAGRKTLNTANKTCFRGIHDNIISDQEVQDSRVLGSHLIAQGGDHFDIYNDVQVLLERVPSIVAKLRNLLSTQYGVSHDIQPIAFRVNAVGPMDGNGVRLFDRRIPSRLEKLLNRTNYLLWMDKAERRNDLALYSLPWPFNIEPVRDVCNLLADLEADPSFSIHTSVFLSEGSGEEFHGGAALYVDNHRDNYHPRRKIQRGLSVDGTRGRVLVSTGGLENRRCRLPVRAGIRATLQIWWSC